MTQASRRFHRSRFGDEDPHATDSVPLLCHLTSVFHSLVSALVLSRLDYCNSLLINLPLTHIQRLQSVQNAAARLIFNLRRCDHITDVLINIHWLRVPERITLKVATLMYPALHGPHHLTWRCHSHVSPTCCTDAGSGLPPLNSLTLTFRTVVGQPSEVVPFLLLEQRCGMACQAMLGSTSASSLSVFKNRLKTYLFRRCYETV